MNIARIAELVVDRGYEIFKREPAFKRHYPNAESYPVFRDPEYQLVYVLPPETESSWILQAICREIDTFFPGHSTMCALGEPLPTASNYFYSHYAFFRETLLRQPQVLSAKNILFYTHPRDLWFTEAELLHTFGFSDSIVNMCSEHARRLESQGVKNIHVSLTGADRNFFVRHDREGRRVGFCSSYYARKNGDRMLEVVQAMPDADFTLCGRNWENWDRWEELNRLPNFQYLQTDYENYPAFYGSLDVLVSVSEIEGGPIPVLEAMMSNVVPVASDTGHAPDIIKHGVNGYLFSIDSGVEDIVDLIEAAFVNTADVRSTVEHLTWKRFSEDIQSLLELCDKAND